MLELVMNSRPGLVDRSARRKRPESGTQRAKDGIRTRGLHPDKGVLLRLTPPCAPRTCVSLHGMSIKSLRIRPGSRAVYCGRPGVARIAAAR
jgi:hypothetical protein